LFLKEIQLLDFIIRKKVQKEINLWKCRKKVAQVFGSFFLHFQTFLLHLQNFLNFQNILWPFKETHGYHIPKNIFECRFPEVKIYDFQKSKYITGSRLSKIKIYHRNLTSENQNISPEIDFRKSKYITGNRLSKIKNHYQKSTSENQKTLRKSTSIYKKIIYFIF